MAILITGGAGFIGANFIHQWCAQTHEAIINLDALSYAGNLESLSAVEKHPHYHFVQGDIGNSELVRQVLQQHSVRAVLNFAAESHVDRSIHGPSVFVQTNIVGTFNLLETVREYWQALPPSAHQAFRFLHVSTDEVFGSLAPGAAPFTEKHPYEPNSPYSASKAASDHLVRAWHHTYGLPVLTTNCSNNYGPYQFPEKLIPLVIVHALAGKKLPIYGDGMQVRDWLYVGDHCEAIGRVLDQGKVGETYNIGGWNEQTNIDIVRQICTLLDQLRPRANGKSYAEQISFVRDRPGHDRRYAIDAKKIAKQLNWKPRESFQSGLAKTVAWYLANDEWLSHVQDGSYRHWLKAHYKG